MFDPNDPAEWCEYEIPFCEESCEFQFAEDKLRMAHRSWHDALSYYQTPRDFKNSINSILQELRSVTFALQAQKNVVKGFQTWYETIQNNLKSDEFMRWTIQARNKVVKQSDLDVHSTSHVAVFSDYDSEGQLDEVTTWEEVSSGRLHPTAGVSFDPPTSISTEEILKVARKLSMPLNVRQETSVTVERRWVVSDFPKHEILALLSYAYAKLRHVVLRAHTDLLERTVLKMGTTLDGEIRAEAIDVEDGLPLAGRLPCMIYTRGRRSKSYRLVDGSVVDEFVNVSTLAGAFDSAEEAEKRYGTTPEPEISDFGTLQHRTEIEAFMKWMAHKGKAILEAGEDHGWFSQYYRNGALVDIQIHEAADPQAKRAVVNNMLATVLKHEADAIFTVTEAWYSPITHTVDGSMVPARLHQQREEFLVLNFLAKSGQESSWVIRFKTLSGESPNRKLIIQEPAKLELTDWSPFQAIKKVWGLNKLHRPGDSFFKR